MGRQPAIVFGIGVVVGVVVVLAATLIATRVLLTKTLPPVSTPE